MLPPLRVLALSWRRFNRYLLPMVGSTLLILALSIFSLGILFGPLMTGFQQATLKTRGGGPWSLATVFSYLAWRTVAMGIFVNLPALLSLLLPSGKTPGGSLAGWVLALGIAIAWDFLTFYGTVLIGEFSSLGSALRANLALMARGGWVNHFWLFLAAGLLTWLSEWPLRFFLGPKGLRGPADLLLVYLVADLLFTTYLQLLSPVALELLRPEPVTRGPGLSDQTR